MDVLKLKRRAHEGAKTVLQERINELNMLARRLDREREMIDGIVTRIDIEFAGLAQYKGGRLSDMDTAKKCVNKVLKDEEIPYSCKFDLLARREQAVATSSCLEIQLASVGNELETLAIRMTELQAIIDRQSYGEILPTTAAL